MSLYDTTKVGNIKVMMLKGEQGSNIESIEKTSTVGNVDTYTVTLTDGTETTFEVTNGATIASIDKTASVGEVDTYTITMTDGSTSTFQVTNGDNWIDNGIKNATQEFQTINGGILSKCDVELSPIQNLHGYDKPWAGGAGKNLLPLTLDNIKSANTTGTWVNNVYTHNSVVYTVNQDSNGNVVSIKVMGSVGNSADSLNIPFNWVANTPYIFNGCPSDGSSNSYRIDVFDETDTFLSNVFDYGLGNTYTPTASGMGKLRIRLVRDYIIPNGGLIFYPMIRLASIADPTFEPYSNICPISGHIESKVYRVGKNLLDIPSSFDTTTVGGVTFTVNRNEDGAVTSIVLNGTASSQIYPYFDFTLSEGSYKINGVTGGTDSTYYVDIQNRTTNTNVAHLKNGDATFSVSEKTTFRAYLNVVSGIVLNNVIMRLMVRHSSDGNSNFEPYKGETFEESLGQTVYGGTLDFVSGKMTITDAFIEFDGSENWQASSIANAYYTNISDSKADDENVICSIGKYASNLTDIGDCRINQYKNFVIKTEFASVDDWKTWLETNHIEVAYKLATPIEIDLSPNEIQSLVGINYIDAPLDHQEIINAEYRYIFTWDDAPKGLLPHINIVSETGSLVTLTKGSKIIRAFETSSGNFEADVPEFGTWRIDSLLNDETATMNLYVDTVKIYSVDDSHFSATITVTYPSGAECNLAGQGESYDATGSPYTFTVHHTGEFTVTCIYDGNIYTESVTVTTRGEEITMASPNPSDAPANDIDLWLMYGGVDGTYSSLADILADSTALETLMASNDAVDYLVKSTTWATDVCSSEDAMTEIGLNNYCANTLIADSDWINAIAGSDYIELVMNLKVPIMDSQTSPDGWVDALYSSGSNDGWKAFDGNDSTYYQGASQNTYTILGFRFNDQRKVRIAQIKKGTDGSSTVNWVVKATNNITFGVTWDELVADSVDISESFTLSEYNAPKRVICDDSTAYFHVYFYSTTGGTGITLNDVQFYYREDV